MNAFLVHAPVAWYVARAAGLVAFGFLTVSVWLGLAMSTRLLGNTRQKLLFGWHQTLAWTGLSMLALHVGALLFDPTLHFGLASVLVPFASPWRPGAVADARRPGETLTTLAIDAGGVATSGRDRRRFGPNRSLHHLIDPLTGAPALTGPLAVTVVAPDPAEAEAHATALAVSTLDHARAHLRRFPHLAALYVPNDGEPVALGALSWQEVAA